MTQAEIYSLWIEFLGAFISALSVLVATAAVFYGVYAWKREHVGKRQIDLAQNILEHTYAVQSAIRDVRNIYNDYSYNRERHVYASETEEQTYAFDRAYFASALLQKYDKLFTEFRALKFRAMAIYGSRSGESFDRVNDVLNQLHHATQLLKRMADVPVISSDEKLSFWGISEDEFAKQFSIITYMDRERDSKLGEDLGVDFIDPQIQQAVEEIEAMTLKYYSEN